MPLRKTPIEKLYWSIGEVAEQLQVNTSVLRFWEKEFGNLRPKRDSKGDRLYTQDDIRKLRVIQYLLKDRRFTIEGAREHLRGDGGGTERLAEVSERLGRMRQMLTDLVKALEKATV